jgi:8-oxo-dGTP pyrophosphatase MutT (NUDIX family)
MYDKRPGAGLVIYHPTESAVLLVRDIRTNKWSFPKGRVESIDVDYMDTAVRETLEETGFIQYKHYVLKNNKSRSCARTYLVDAQALTSELPFTSRKDQYVAEVAWMPISKVNAINGNLSLRMWAQKEGW